LRFLGDIMKFKNTTTPMLAKYITVHYYTTDFDEAVFILDVDYDDYLEFLKEWHGEDLIRVQKFPAKRYEKVKGA